MTLASKLLSVLDRRDVTFQSVFSKGGNVESLKTASGVSVSEEKALRLVTVYSCVSLISETVATLPWDAVRRRDGRREHVSKPTWMEQPNPIQSEVDFKQQMLTSLLLWGNFYGLKILDDFGFPMEVWPIHPAEMEVERKSLSEVVYRVNGTEVPNHEVLHIRALGAPGSAVGLSPIGAAKQAVGLALAAEEFGARFFGNGANPSGVLETEHNLTGEQAKALAMSWRESHAGLAKAKLPAVLEGGVTWRQITVPPEEAQFLETRKFQRSEICGLYRVPPHLVGDVERSTSWGTGIEQQSIGFVTYTLGPWLARIERALSALLRGDQQVKFNVNGLLRGDAKTRFEAYATAINNSWMNPDEVRSKEDLPPIPDGEGQKFRQPMNHGPLGIDPSDNPDVPNEPNADSGA